MSTKIVTQIGNLLHVDKGHVVHGCNAQGAMGSGVALGVKQTWPIVFTHYKYQYNNHGLILGRAYPVNVNSELTVWNAITQDEFGPNKRHTNYEAVATCFEQINTFLSSNISNIPVNHVHIPLIGAVRGGANWEIIREIIEQTIDYPVTLWLPDNTVTTR